MKKFILLAFLILLPLIIFSKNVDKFDEINVSDFTYTMNNIELFLSPSIYHSPSGSLRIARDIRFNPSPEEQWTEGNEVIYNLPSPADFSSDEYFIFWYYDEEKVISGNGASIIEVGLFDGDEWWYSAQNLTEIAWGQMCIPIAGLDVTNAEFIDGFAIPGWERSEPDYLGDGIFNKGNIQQIKFAFGAGHEVIGNFYIDDISSVSFIAKSLPINNAHIDSQLSVMKIYFEEKIAEASVSNASSVIILNKTTGLPVPKTVSYDDANNILRIENFSLIDNQNYEIILTNIFFYGLRKADTYRINFNTAYPVEVIPQSNTIIQDYTDGFYVSLPPDSVSSKITVNIKSFIPKFDALAGKQVFPLNQKLRKNSAVIFFTDEYDNYPNLKILQKKDGMWKEIPSIWYQEKGYIKGEIEELGEFVLVSDTSPPKTESILSVKPLSNPFTPNGDGKNDIVYFNYTLSYGGSLTVKIYNSNGYLIRTIIEDENVSAGTHENIYWNGKNDQGNTVKEGIYIYVFSLERGVFSETEYYTWYENAPQNTVIRGVIGAKK